MFDPEGFLRGIFTSGRCPEVVKEKRESPGVTQDTSLVPVDTGRGVSLSTRKRVRK